MPDKPEERDGAAAGRAVSLGLRLALAAGASFLLMVGGLATYPLGMFIFGLPLVALGLIVLYKSVFW